MKKAEWILGSFLVVSFILNILSITGGIMLSVLSYGILANFYLFLGFALFNNISIRGIFQRDTYQTISIKRLVGAFLVSFALVCALQGILFKLQAWPGAPMVLGYGLAGLGIAAIVATWKFIQTKSGFYTRILKRMAIIGRVGIILLPLPNDVFPNINSEKNSGATQSAKVTGDNNDKKE